MTVSFNPLKANGQLFTHLPQLCKLATHVPSGPLWVHEIKFDGYRMATRTTPGKVQLLTRSGLDWTAKYPATAAALTKLPVQSAYLDGELCAVRPNGISDFGLMQQASTDSRATIIARRPASSSIRHPPAVATPPITIPHGSFARSLPAAHKGRAGASPPSPQAKSTRPWLASLRPHHPHRFFLPPPLPGLADGQGFRTRPGPGPDTAPEDNKQ